MSGLGIEIKGDFAKLAKLTDRFETTSRPKFRAEMSRVLAAEALKLVQMGFRTSTDPYGNAWAALKHRKGKPLLDTARLRSSFSAHSDMSGFVVGTNVTYAKFHQYGTGGRKKASTERRFTSGGKFISSRKAKHLSDLGKIRSQVELIRLERAESQLAKRLAKSKGKKRSRIQQALERVKIAKMRAGVTKQRNKLAAVSSTVGVRFLKFQAGSGAIVARPMLPEGVLPREWRDAFESTSKRFISRIMRGT